MSTKRKLKPIRRLKLPQKPAFNHLALARHISIAINKAKEERKGAADTFGMRSMVSLYDGKIIAYNDVLDEMIRMGFEDIAKTLKARRAVEERKKGHQIHPKTGQDFGTGAPHRIAGMRKYGRK